MCESSTSDHEYTEPLKPFKVTPTLSVPKHIQKPSYADDGEPILEMAAYMGKIPIYVHNPNEILRARKACELARIVLDLAGSMIKSGVTTDDIDKACHKYIVNAGAYPSPLNYKKFPKSICTSVNEVVCHGIPDKRPLKDGDIVNVDITVYLDGFHGDVNETFFVGTLSNNVVKFVEAVYNCLMLVINKCKPGMLYREIGNIISKYIKSKGYSVAKSYGGHGVGRLFHTKPIIPHYAKNKAIGIMKPGHIFTIEPMINQKGWKEKLWSDGWTSVTMDGCLSAQFEHTLLITETGCEILTGRTSKSWPYSWIKPCIVTKQHKKAKRKRRRKRKS